MGVGWLAVLVGTNVRRNVTPGPAGLPVVAKRRARPAGSGVAPPGAAGTVAAGALRRR